MPIFPDTPFKVNVINANAQAYSPDGTRPWGIIPDTHRTNIEIVAKGVYFLVGTPLWANDRQWRVNPNDIEVVIPPTPPSDGKKIVSASLHIHFDDGSTLDQNLIPENE